MWSMLLILACTEAPDAPDSGLIVDCSERDYSTLPSGRGELQGIWDPIGKRLVLFGGNEGIPQECSYAPSYFSGETWAFYEECGNFERIDADGPSKRGRFAAAYDPTGHRMLIHGGRTRADGGSGDYRMFDELWAFDLADETWSRLSRNKGPAARVSHTAVVSQGQLIVHGGNSSANGGAYVPHSDTWSYDLESGKWEALQTSGSPPKRLFHGSDLSRDENTLYVFGGGDEGAFLGPFMNDLWSLDLTSLQWRELHPGGSDAPRGRLGAALVVDDVRDRLVLFGGHDDGELGNTNDVWQFDRNRSRWRQLSPGDQFNNPPAGFCDFPEDFTTPDFESPERRHQGVATPTGDGRMMVFGGKTDCGASNDVWEFNLTQDAWLEHSAATTGEICLRGYRECVGMCI